MKVMKNYAISLLLLAAILMTSGCKKKPDPKPRNSPMELLIAHPWDVVSVKVDGVDQTDLFTGLTVKFTAGGFTATNGDPVWPSSGTWLFGDEQATIINRGDGVDMQIGELTETALILKLYWDQATYGPGRVGSVEGEHVFSFSN